MSKKIKTIFKTLYYLPSNCINKINYKLHHVNVGKKHETIGSVFLKIASNAIVNIGDSVRIRSKATANPIGVGNRTYLQVLNGAKLTIGNHTGMSNCAITVAERVTIGNYVRIGAGVKIYDTDFHSIIPEERTSIPESKNVGTKPIIIEDYAFIGAGSYILKGVTIGEGAVIGAAAVVTKNVPKYEIWAGNPAKKVGNVPRN